jgi:hypothetical protein
VVPTPRQHLDPPPDLTTPPGGLPVSSRLRCVACRDSSRARCGGWHASQRRSDVRAPRPVVA